MSTNQTPNPIVVGAVVLFENGWYRVTRVTKNTVNLGAIFGNRIYHKGVDITQVVEDHDNWYKNWSRSETYQCM